MKPELLRHLNEHGMTEEQIRQAHDTYGVGPFLTVDMVIVTVKWTEEPSVRATPAVLVIKRKNVPFQGWYALPGGFVDLDEDLEHAARRELQEETGVSFQPSTLVDQLAAFGTPGRDPRGRNVSVAYLALVPWSALPLTRAGDDAAETAWLPLRDGVLMTPDGREQARLAFDHEQIIDIAQQRIEQLARHAFAPAVLLPDSFTDEHVAALYAALAPHARTPRSCDDLVNRGWANADTRLTPPENPWICV